MNSNPKGSRSASSESVKFIFVPHLPKMCLPPIPVGFIVFALDFAEVLMYKSLDWYLAMHSCIFPLSQLLHPLQKQEILPLKSAWLYHYIFNSQLKFSFSRLHLPRAEVLDPKHAFHLFVNMFTFTLKWGLNSAPCAISSKYDVILRNSYFLSQYRRFFPQYGLPKF